MQVQVCRLLCRAVTAIILLVFAGTVVAETNQQVLEGLSAARPDFRFGEVKPTPAKGIYQAKIENGPVIYITEDGKHFFAGDFFEVTQNGIINIAERELEGERKAQLTNIDRGDLIVFSPAETKAYVYVFTDVDCYYCQKLHSEVGELNELGIEVRYLAYPRAGIGSPSYRKIASAWCAQDPNDALTRLKAGEEVADNVCDSNPVESQFKLGGQLGVSGTPALVTKEGRLLPGYMPAAKLAEALGL